MLEFSNIVNTNRKFLNRTLRFFPLIALGAIAFLTINRFGGLRFEQYLFILILPFTLRKAHGQGQPMIFISLSFALFLLFFLTNVYSIFYLAVGMGLFASVFLIQLRPSLLSIILLGLTTPAVKYLLSVFSFPIKLQLTSWSGSILSILYSDIEIAGNCIYNGGIEFTVAQECLGLSMISTALAFAIFIMAFISTNTHKKPPFYLIVLFLISSVLLVTLANLSRIVLTISLNAMPDTFVHELIGILLFISNCCLPLIVLGRYTKRYYKTIRTEKLYKISNSYWSIILPVLALFSLLIEENKLAPDFNSDNIELTGFSKETRKDGIVKFRNKESLIYVKPPAFTLGSDHNPFICWKASGYSIKNEQEIKLGQFMAYTFELHKKDEQTLYSCWWYSNGYNNTISQLDWRLAMLNGEKPYCVINTTSTEKSQTVELTKLLMSQNFID